MGAILEAELTKNLIFRPFGPPEWSSIHSFGLLINFWCWDRFSLTLLMRFGNLVCPTWGLHRFTGAILEAELTKNLIFRQFGPPEWSSIHSFGLLTNFWCWDRFSLTLLMRFRNLVCTTGGLYWLTGAILEAELTKNLIFWPFGPPEWSSIHSFGLLTKFWCWDRFSLTWLMRFRNFVCPTGGHQWFRGVILVADVTKNLIFRPFGRPEWSSIPSFGLLTKF